MEEETLWRMRAQGRPRYRPDTRENGKLHRNVHSLERVSYNATFVGREVLNFEFGQWCDVKTKMLLEAFFL